MSETNDPRRPAAKARLSEVPWSAATFLGAALLFLVEPMVGKTMLPLLGGAPATWNACVFLFQALLLLGYGYAHASTSRLSTRRQAVVQLVLLALAVALLPLLPPASGPPPQGGTAGWLLAVLVPSLGLPFAVLAASTPLLQRWYSRASPSSARDPYFLYAVSNASSLLALLAYPTLVEPLLPLSLQYRLWRLGYAVYAVMVLVCALRVWRMAAGAATEGDGRVAGGSQAPAAGAPSRATVEVWVALSAVPASLMLGVTSYLSTDVAVVPLLWVVTLSLYLLSLVVAFSRLGAPLILQAARSLPMLALLVGLLLIGRFDAPLALLVPLHLGAFAAASLACHGELARRRPPPERLTRYYLWVAVGGMLGGAFNALVAPAVFSDVSEYPIALVLACALRPAPGGAGEALGRGRIARDAAWAVVAGALVLGAVLWANGAAPGARAFAAVLAVPVLVAYRQAASPRRHAAALALMLLAGRFYEREYGTLVHAERSFFGVYRVQEDRGYRFLTQGTTLHGMESLDPARRAEALAYYHRDGPFGEAFAALPAAGRGRIAVVGLGAGALASYARPGQRWVFFEIDPVVERLARDPRYFGYLADCGAGCRVEIGDARLALAASPQRRFDLIVLDAFSSDAIPVHLVTHEAFALYRSRLAEGGAILVHFSNRDLALEPVLGRGAREVGLEALVGSERVSPLSPDGRLSSEWMALAARPEDLGPLAGRARWRPPQVPASTPLWSDDFSNLLGVLRLGRKR